MNVSLLLTGAPSCVFSHFILHENIHGTLIIISSASLKIRLSSNIGTFFGYLEVSES